MIPVSVFSSTVTVDVVDIHTICGSLVVDRSMHFSEHFRSSVQCTMIELVVEEIYCRHRWMSEVVCLGVRLLNLHWCYYLSDREQHFELKIRPKNFMSIDFC